MTAMRSFSSSLQELGLRLLAGDVAGLSDAELVGRFAAHRDEAAFTALVRRHGTVVFGVCRRVLRHEQDAEDAFQATFLVLARHAASLKKAGAVGNWLYGVAYNVARKAKALRQRREFKERQAMALQRPENRPDSLDDFREVLDGELHGLPDIYRTPIVLCDFRGLTIREAAAEVGCPQKTLSTRLSRGRSLLAGRLSRRGVVISAGALAAAISACASAAPPAPLIGLTVTGSIGFLAGSATVSPGVLVLTEGVSNLMFPKTLKSFAVLACCVLAVGGLSVGLVQHVGMAAQGSSPHAAGEALPGDQRNVKKASPSDPLHQLHLVIFKLFSQFAGNGAGQNAVVVSDDQKEDKAALSGTWTRKGADQEIEINKDVMKISAHKGDLIIVCQYAVDKEGLVKVKITAFEGKDELKEKVKEKLPVGFEFRFQWKVKDGVATLDDLKGDNVELLKSHLEGNYEPKK